jgi:gelsolin
MSGLVKQKEYDWQDTNMALFGSDVEKNIKKAAAESEAQWKHVGEKVELRIWRIEQFKVVPWPSKKIGQFHEGDSYIILNTYVKDPKENPDKIDFDVHFWIGKFSTQDEYGTAAYKTVELDHLLDDKAIQHREVMEHESKLFHSYFPRGIQVLQGGVDTGFTHVEDDVIPTRLFQVKGVKGNIMLKEIKLKRDAMNSGDTFILDTGDVIFQWNGKEANVHEKRQAQEFVQLLRTDRGGDCVVKTMDEGSDGNPDDEKDEFWGKLPGKRKMMGITVGSIEVKSADKGGEDEEVKAMTPVLYRLHEGMGLSSGLSFSKKYEGDKIPKNNLLTGDVFVLDNGFHIYIWVGAGASQAEKGKAFPYAHKYLKDHKRPEIMPVSRIVEGREPESFMKHFGPAVQPKGCCIIA